MKLKFFCEFVSTFLMMFVGIGSIYVNVITNGQIGPFGVSASFGIIISLMIYLFGNISGAHMNPAVTLSLAVNKTFEKNLILGYLVAQGIGAGLACFILQLIFPDLTNIGLTLPKVNIALAIILECLLTFFLLIIVLKVGGSKFAAVIIGLFIFIAAYFIGPYTGASMNPFRTLAPALFSDNSNLIWIYFVGPILGGILAVLANHKFSKN